MKVYVQIGANIGNDDFQRVIQNSIEKLKVILVEPNQVLIDTLSKNYDKLKDKHDVIICPYGISLTNDTAKLYLYGEHGHSSLLNRDPVNPVTSIVEVPTKTFSSLCEQFDITEVEYLSIDTEGLDYEILNSMDISKIDIKTIVFEKWNIDNDDFNKTYRTGINFLNEFVKPKFINYEWEDIVLDGAPTYKLSKH